MNVIVKEKSEQKVQLVVGDMIVYENELYILMQHKEGYMFTDEVGGGYNGMHQSLSHLTKETMRTLDLNGATLCRKKDYEVHLVPKS